jgi:uncharacterized protein (DUF1810 family)
MPGLDRFKVAQDAVGSGFDQALQEIRSGGKQSHWIWYIFPQLGGLGTSYMAREYAIRDAAEAEDFLRDPTLFPRLLTITRAVLEQLSGSSGARVTRVMGSSIDAQKLVSSMTLFGLVARRVYAREGEQLCGELADAADRILTIAASQGYPSCKFTLR